MEPNTALVLALIALPCASFALRLGVDYGYAGMDWKEAVERGRLAAFAMLVLEIAAYGVGRALS